MTLPSTTVGWISLGAHVVAISSIVHVILPPWEIFNDYPRIQRAYKLFVYLVGYAAIAIRSVIHPDLSTSEGSEVSLASTNPSLTAKGGQDDAVSGSKDKS
jgi:hypothetical protein